MFYRFELKTKHSCFNQPISRAVDYHTFYYSRIENFRVNSILNWYTDRETLLGLVNISTIHYYLSILITIVNDFMLEVKKKKWTITSQIYKYNAASW